MEEDKSFVNMKFCTECNSSFIDTEDTYTDACPDCIQRHLDAEYQNEYSN